MALAWHMTEAEGEHKHYHSVFVDRNEKKFGPPQNYIS